MPRAATPVAVGCRVHGSAGLGHIHAHQLKHSAATAMVWAATAGRESARCSGHRSDWKAGRQVERFLVREQAEPLQHTDMDHQKLS